ncbi:MAG TPA: hypothetical protein VNN17_03095 [Terriglobia bacterium]|nr:hypothetical protein [Terriglobia bacterium]
MNLKKGERWVCKESYCGAEIEVLKGANTSCPGQFIFRCCCGKEMTLKKAAPQTGIREPPWRGRQGSGKSPPYSQPKGEDYRQEIRDRSPLYTVREGSGRYRP